jgi:hypothetical protein
MQHHPDFISWEIVGTYAGAVAVVTMVMRFAGDLLRQCLPMVDRRIWFFLAALIIMEAATIFTGNFNAADIVLIFFNAFGVALTALGVEDTVLKKQ